MAKSVAIIGGGLTGSLAAIALAGRGCRVTLIDRRGRILQGASRNNEGKVHLGFTYGLDPSGETARLMTLHGAAYTRIVSELTGLDEDRFVLHRNSIYALPEDTAMGPEAAAPFLAEVARGCTAAGLPGTVRRLDEDERGAMFGPRIIAAFEVPEVFIDTDLVCDAAERMVIDSPAIETMLSARVLRIEGTDRPVVVMADGQRLGPFDAVVNSSWEGLADIATASGLPPQGLCLRAKAGFIARVEAGMPALPVTLSYGPFGDIVPIGGDLVFMSWYPSCLFGFSPSADGGAAWYDSMLAAFDQPAAYAEGKARFEQICRGLRLADSFERVRAGAIIAVGNTDIRDPQSGLHQRTKIGIRRDGPVLTVNTGKFTSSPFMAKAVADSITA